MGDEPEETDSVRWVVPKEPGLVRVDWFELLLIPHEVLRWCREILLFPLSRHGRKFNSPNSAATEQESLVTNFGSERANRRSV